MCWWDKAGAIEEIRSPALGTVHGVSDDERTGEHVMHSLVMLRHPDDAVRPRALAGLGLCDIAATVQRLANVT